jgi:hypothetical protein
MSFRGGSGRLGCREVLGELTTFDFQLLGIPLLAQRAREKWGTPCAKGTIEVNIPTLSRKNATRVGHPPVLSVEVRVAQRGVEILIK